MTITFDDGCETDLLVAAPILRQAGFNATFFITWGRLGKLAIFRRNSKNSVGKVSKLAVTQ